MTFRSKLITYLVFVLLLIQFSYAQNDLRISIDIEELNSYIDYFFKLEHGINNFNLEVPKNSQIIYLRDDYGDINYKNENDTLIMDLIESEKERLILMKLKTKTSVSKKDNYYELIFESKNYGKVTINLPDNVIPNSIQTNPKTEIKVYDKFSYVDFDVRQGDILIIRYKVLNSNYWIYVVVILIILIVAYFLIKRNKKRKVKKNEEIKSIKENNDESYHSNIVLSENKTINKDQILKSLNLLNEKEKNVVEYVLNHEGCLQSDLQKEVGYTKSNLTKIIKKLEFRALIKKKNIGKINRLYLGEKVK